MKNQFKLLVVASMISLGMFACKGSIDSGNAGTAMPEDSVKTGGIDVKESHVDTAGKSTNGYADTSKMSTTDTVKK